MWILRVLTLDHWWAKEILVTYECGHVRTDRTIANDEEIKGYEEMA
jgi:hypothetical protein